MERTKNKDFLTMAWLFSLYFLHLLGVSGAEVLSLHRSNTMAVSVSLEDLSEVSRSVLMAEAWLRTHVLAYYPASKTTHIVVGHNILCLDTQQDKFGLILPAMTNLHHSLTRWGLQKDIRVSPSLSSHCLDSQSTAYRNYFCEEFIRPLLSFIHRTNSTYLVNLLQSSPSISHESLVSTHLASMRKLGFFDLNDINVIINGGEEAKPTSRKLFYSFDPKVIDPYPARPTPLPKLSPSYSAHISIPAHIAKRSLPPLVGSDPPSPSFPLPLAPTHSPLNFPATPPYSYHLPPCDPSGGGIQTPPPVAGGGVMGEKVWCVAKPSVPAETLQEAMDYACGEGGGDCDEIQPQGNCYYPDTAVAHASFAFNSYWQKNKRHGGSCSFGGTAMIITADPSFLNCRFIVS